MYLYVGNNYSRVLNGGKRGPYSILLLCMKSFPDEKTQGVNGPVMGHQTDKMKVEKGDCLTNSLFLPGATYDNAPDPALGTYELKVKVPYTILMSHIYVIKHGFLH